MTEIIKFPNQKDSNAEIEGYARLNMEAGIFATLAAMPEMMYEQLRIEQAKKMGCRPSALDKIVNRIKKKFQHLLQEDSWNINMVGETIHIDGKLHFMIGSVENHYQKTFVAIKPDGNGTVVFGYSKRRSDK